MKNYFSIDLFSGAGGLTEGLKQAGFNTLIAVELDKNAAEAFHLNHPKTEIFQRDIKTIRRKEIEDKLNGNELHLLAGCPPCQGFSSIRRLNRSKCVKDDRNSLVLEYLRMVKELKPLTIMMENVPALENYYQFKYVISELQALNYDPKVEAVNVKDYGIPQRRKRLVMVGSRLGNIEIFKGNIDKRTVRDAIGNMPAIEDTDDLVHKIIPHHRPEIVKYIKRIPKNGGSRKDVPEIMLDCHKSKNIGFNDVYGRLRWDDYANTITGGCLNPSKGRFLHPDEDRNISAREAALLQSFPIDYKFPTNIPKSALALLIGNALPPHFSYLQALNIKQHLDTYLK